MKQINLIISALSAVMIGLAAASCDSDSSAGSHNDSTGGSGGKGGSMARFTICGDYLYTVDDYSLKITRISDPENPRHVNTEYNLWSGDIETIFPYEDMLFIGSRSGMYIYDISGDPKKPQQISYTPHFTACDPVVAYGDYAYVTLSSGGNACNRSRNALIVYDISGIYEADGGNYYDKVHEVREYDYLAIRPSGLGIDGPAGLLFVCTSAGVDVYDLTDPARPAYKQDLADIPGAEGLTGYDAITLGGRLIVIGPGGLYQFDYTGEDIKFVSSLEIDLNREK